MRERLDDTENVHVEIDGAHERQGEVERQASRQGKQGADEYLQN